MTAATHLVLRRPVSHRAPSPRTIRCQQCGGLAVPGDIRAEALRVLAADLEGCTDETWRFFRTLLEAERPYTRANVFARDLGLVPSSLLSRFFRAGLPSPKRYVLYAQALRLAAAGIHNVMDAAVYLDASSPQSCGRMIRTAFGVTLATFLANETGATMLERFRRDLILPYRASLIALGTIQTRARRTMSERAAPNEGQK